MKRYYVAGAVLAAGIAAALALLLEHGQTATQPKPRPQLLPAAQPEYARSLQGILTAARPKGAPAIVVKDCRRGRRGNEHFCAWLYGGGCRAGFILEDPGQGTVPVLVREVPLPPAECSTARVLRWLHDQAG